MKIRIICFILGLIMLFSFMPVTAENIEVIISTDSAEYKESPEEGWADSSVSDGIGGKKTRFNGAAGSSAEWRPALTKGSYIVSVFKPVHETSDTETRIEVFHANGSDSKKADYSKGASEWLVLGVYDFNDGTDGYVKVTRGNNILRTGSVKFTPASGGSGNTSIIQLFSDIDNSKYKTSIELTAQLGLFQGQTSGSFAPFEGLTRAEAAAVAVRTMGFMDKIASSATSFSDVPASHWASGYINHAAQHGVISGIDSQRYEPESKVTYNQFVKMMVHILGYDYRAVHTGGYPLGYLSTAAGIGLTSGVTSKGEELITREEVAKILSNACNIDIMEPYTIGSELQYRSISGNNIITVNLKLKKVEGIVTANSFTALNSSSNLNNDEVKIGSDVYIEGAYPASALLGYYVTAYVTDREFVNEREKIAAITVSENRNKSITIKSEDIAPSTESILNYYTSSDKSRTSSLKLSPKADLIYNGAAKFSWSESDLQRANGTVTLIDNNGDSQYDLIYVRDYEDMVVKGVNANEKTVTFMYAGFSGLTHLKLDSDDVRIRFNIIESTGIKADPMTLKEWDILSVALSEDGSRIEGVVGRQKVQNSVTEIFSDDDGRKVVINGGDYLISQSMERLIVNGKIKDIELDSYAVYYMNYKNEIVIADYDVTVSHGYGYLVGAHASKMLDKGITFKIFSDSGKWEVLDLADKVKVNGSVFNLDQQIIAMSAMFNEGVFTRQLITYNKNADGKLCEYNTATSGNSLDEFSLVFSGTLIYRSIPKILGTQFLLNDSTKIFFVPPEAQSDDEGMYRIETLSVFRGDGEYADILVYDQNNNMVAGAVVYEDTAKVIYNSGIGVVDKVSKVIDSDGELVTSVQMYIGGKLTGYTVKTELTDVDVTTNLKETTSAVKIEELKKGDIVQFILNGSKIVNMRTLLLVTQKEIFERHGSLGTEIATEHSYSHELYYAYGTVSDLIASGVKLKSRYDWIRAVYMVNPFCYIYDSRNEILKTALISDIMIDDTVFVQSINHGAKIIVIYR